MTVPMLLLATTLGLLALAYWWFRPIFEAIKEEAAVATARTRPVAPGLADPECGIGIALMASAASGGGGGTGTRTRPKRKKPTGPDRRAFLRNAWTLAWAGVAGAFGLSVLGFMWPRIGGGFGATINMGTVDDVLAQIDDGGGRLEFPAGRLYMVRYDASKDDEGVYSDVTQGGEAPAMAIYQKCVHLGCRVPWCDSSKWFECPCHGSRYNRWGEYEFGPAPRGLDRFPTEIRDGVVFVNTGQIVTGPSRTTAVLGEPAAGPNCN